MTGTESSPDTDVLLRTRRVAFIRCLVRRTIHLAVKHGTIIPALVALIHSILTTLHGQDPRIWYLMMMIHDKDVDDNVDDDVQVHDTGEYPVVVD